MAERLHQTDQAQLCTACQIGFQGDISWVAEESLGKPRRRIPHHSRLVDVQNAAEGGCFLCTHILDEISSIECTGLVSSYTIAQKYTDPSFFDSRLEFSIELYAGSTKQTHELFFELIPCKGEFFRCSLPMLHLLIAFQTLQMTSTML